ncbi:MAG: sensor histidine kinase, partial [Sarcina sp.]
LFEYTKLTSNDFLLNYSECNLNSLINQIVGEYSYIFEKENLNLIEDLCEEELIINLDIERMVRVLDNLISNAIKYSIKQSDIKVCLYKKEQKAIITISNEVNDFDKKDIKQIFERFYRIDKARCEEGSSGLGLSIAKAIVDLHKGNIYASLDDEIITFTVELNLYKNKME